MIHEKRLVQAYSRARDEENEIGVEKVRDKSRNDQRYDWYFVVEYVLFNIK